MFTLQGDAGGIVIDTSTSTLLNNALNVVQVIILAWIASRYPNDKGRKTPPSKP